MKTKVLKRASVMFLALMLLLSSMSLTTLTTVRADEDTSEVVAEEVVTAAEDIAPVETEAPAEPVYVEETQEVFDAPAATEEAAAETTAETTAKTETEEETKEETETAYPAASFSGAAGGVEVFVAADEGTFPEGTTMTVIGVSASQVYDVANAAVAGEVTNVKAVDITFYGPNGQEVQPLKNVHMTMNVPGMNQSANKSVIHIADNGAANVVANASVVGDNAYVEAGSFSIYLVVGTDLTPQDQNAVATYEFYVDNELVMTQYIKTGDKLTDPGTSVVNADAANTVFKGWFVGETAVDFDNEQTVEATETIRVDAKIQKTYYVTFWGEADADGNRGIVAVKSVTVEGDETGTVNIDGVSVTPKADTSAFKGWSEAKTGTETISGSTVEVSGRMDLYAVVVDAYWLHFYENVGEDSDSDATYTGPVFIAETDVRSDKKPANPTRKGYEFGGWYLEESCETAFDWDATGLEEDTDLYAKWTPGEADFTVIVWKQKVTDAKDAADSAKTYDFELSHTWTGETGETVDLSQFSMYEELEFTGFHYSRMEASPETVKADGSTVVNVYYDRNLLTIRFVDGTDLVYREATNNNGTQYGLINDEYIQLERHGNGANVYWTYDVSHNYSGTTYRQATNNQGTQYGFVNGQMVQLTYHPQFIGGYWTYGNNVRYNGTRYLQNATGNSGYGVVDGELVGISRQSGQWVYTEEVRYTGTRYVTATEPHTEEYTGLYGQTLTQNGYTWPDERAWYQNPNSGGTRLTFLDAFKFEGLSGTSENNTVLTQYGANQTGTNYIRFYKQNIDGSWPASSGQGDSYTDRIRSSGGTFTITEKYEGFKAVQYAYGGNWTNGGAGTSTNATNLQIRFERQKFTLTLMSESEVFGTVDNIPYEDSLSQHEPTSEPTKAHYNFVGWFEDPAGQVEFDWNQTMPAANKVIYAKFEPKQYHVSLDPKDGEFINAQVGEFNVPLDTILDKTSLFQNVVKEGHELIGWFDAETGEAYGFGKIEEDVSLVAKWRYPGQVQVVYDASPNGSGAPEDNYKYATDSSVVLGAPPETVNTGYAFVGWSVGGKKYYTNNTFDITESLIENYNPTTKTGTVTVKAIYQELGTGALTPTTITYNANGGTGDDVVIPVDPDKLLINQPVSAKSADECGFTRDGYEFTGWNTMKDGTGLDVAAGDDIAADLRNLDKNTDINTLYAQWKLIEYTVVYTDGVEGEVVFEDKTTEGLTVEDDTPEFGDDPTRDGYEFDGWDPDYTEELNVDEADDNNVITYTAQWAKLYTVTYKYEEPVPAGAPAVPEPKEYKAGATVEKAAVPTLDGYVFSGWTGEPETMPEANVTVTGKWIEEAKAVPYTVEHYLQDLDDETAYTLEDTEELSGTVGETVIAQEKTYPGFAFDETIDGTVMEGDLDEDEELVLKLYYTRNTYKITFDPNGGTLEGSTDPIVEEHKYGETITIKDAPEYEGHEFLYWEGSQYNPGDTYEVVEDHKFTAKWKEPEEETTPEGGSEVKTGDSSNMALFIMLGVAALAAIIFALKKLLGQTK